MSPARRAMNVANIRGKAIMSFDIWYQERETEFKNNGLQELFELRILTLTANEWFDWFISDMAIALELRTPKV